MPLLLQRKELRPLVADPEFMATAIGVFEEVFREYQRGQVCSYPYNILPLNQDGESVNVVSAASPTTGPAVRVSPGFGGNHHRVDSRVVVLLDPDTGQLQALIGDNDLNVVRTGAPVGIACRYLAPPGARTAALLGSGRQAPGQVLALHAALPALERVRVYSPTREHRERFVAAIRERVGIAVEAVEEPRQAVEGADVIALAANSAQPVLDTAWVRPGALLVSIAHRQVPPDLVVQARVFTIAPARIVEERREPYSTLIAAGRWSLDRIAGELGEVMLGRVPAREHPDEVVLCELPGLPIGDAAIGRLAYNWAVAHGVGTPFHVSAD
jgi:ornithine cyclodeaminase/alanine dehydrogenase-like protein (mu-crystallin family)